MHLLMMGVLGAVVLAAIGAAWALARRRARLAALAAEEEDMRRRLGVTDHGESRTDVRQKAVERARAKRLAAQDQLNILADEGRALLERAEHWKENDERPWRDEFADFADRLRESAHAYLAPGAAVTIDVECKAVRRASWPAYVSVTQASTGQLSVERGTLVHAVDTLLRTFTAATEAMAQEELSSSQPEPMAEEVDALVEDAKKILQEIARNATLSEYELWTIVHGWRDRMRGVLTQQGAAHAAEYINGAPPTKKIPYVKSVSSKVPGQLQPMRQLAGWLDRLDTWRRERGADAR